MNEHLLNNDNFFFKLQNHTKKYIGEMKNLTLFVALEVLKSPQFSGIRRQGKIGRRKKGVRVPHPLSGFSRAHDENRPFERRVPVFCIVPESDPRAKVSVNIRQTD